MKRVNSLLLALAGLCIATSVSAAPDKRPVPACTITPVQGTQTVAAGQVFDGVVKYGHMACLVGSNSSAGQMDGTQAEKQIPHFILQEGATLKNIVLGNPNLGSGRNLAAGGADGVHCRGNCTMENVFWGDVGEDAATLVPPAKGNTMTIRGGAAYKGQDKIFQNNGDSTTIVIENFYAENSGKLYRSCGNCSSQSARKATITNVRIVDFLEGVGVNSSFDASLLPNLANAFDVATMTDFASNRPDSRCGGFVGATPAVKEPAKETIAANVTRSCVFK